MPMKLDSVTADALRAALATVVAIPVTPFGPDGRVDWDTYPKLLHRLVDSGVTVVTPNGNTGEFYTLSPAEARRGTEAATAAIGQPAEVLVGVGLDTATAIEAARHARDAGARMVMVHQPVHPYLSADGWLEYNRAIADAVPDMGIVLYLRDPHIGGAQIGRLGESCQNVIGIKYAVPDPVRFASVARDAGLDRFTWIAGLAELYAPAYWAVGATGLTSGLVNVAPALSIGMLDALRAGDFSMAMKVWESVRPFEELRAADSSADNVSVVKEALAQLGLCRADVRPPSRSLPGEVRTRITAILDAWGLRPGQADTAQADTAQANTAQANTAQANTAQANTAAAQP
jgi:4-hydroxy-tetrahydrodipicolinate synthase